MPGVPRNQMTGQVSTKLGRVSLNPRGQYQAKETYDRLDIVQFGNSGWICRKDATSGVEPVEGENWMRFADNGSAAMYQEIQELATQVQADKTAADQSATEAAESAETASTAKADAETARDEAQTASSTATEKAEEASQSADTAKQYSGNPPIIGENGNWETWDAETGDYVTTGKPSRGEKGDRGEQGPPGRDGTGAGDMTKDVYDKENRQQDIYEAIDEAVKNVRIDMDPMPTEGSQNAVTSGGVYTALAGKQDAMTPISNEDINTIWDETGEEEE